MYEEKISTVIEYKTIYKTKISELDLSVKVQNSLLRAGIFTIEDVINKSDKELLNVRNLGEKLLEEIREKIEQYKCNVENKKAIKLGRKIKVLGINELEVDIQNLKIDDENKEKLLDKLNNKKSEIKRKLKQEMEEKIERLKDFIKADEILDLKISELNLSARAYNGLNRASISTVGDLVIEVRKKQ